MSALTNLLQSIEKISLTNRDKGTSFENLMIQYFLNEPKYAEIYTEVLSYSDWVEKYGEKLKVTDKRDYGIDLIAVTIDGEFHPIQCKNYNTTKIQKKDIDSFLGGSGKSYFAYRYIVASTDDWTDNAKSSLVDANPPVATISLLDLEGSLIDWSQFNFDSNVKPIFRKKNSLRDHQRPALSAVKYGLAEADRGKLIMACGTGKTFTSLRIAEELVGRGKNVLFLVPSLALLSQTLDEWTQQTSLGIRSFAVCSDSDVGKKKDDDNIVVGISDLKFPATTNPQSLVKAFKARDLFKPNEANEDMNVVFSTYHSIDVIAEAQKAGFPEFDLIICDEAHRTTGATFEGDDESKFVRIHNNDYVQGKKRLYMTATPRIYGDTAKETEGVTLCSMDDKSLYGEDLYVITFSQAVKMGILCDYKVIVLAVEESHINRQLQGLLKDENNSLKVDDAAKIVGCWKALAKQGLYNPDGTVAKPMERAVAFCQVIEKEYKGKKHKVSSKQITEMFSAVVEAYQQAEMDHLYRTEEDPYIDPSLKLNCEVKHVDGGMNATEKKDKITWLKETAPENTCRILSNVRCLSEGVDVPSLDAVLFLTPRNSQVDVVQSVGRVMRKADGKQLGYVILPVVIPAGVEPEQALNSNEAYRVVWQVLNALRAHDDRFDAMINKLEFNGKDVSRMEVIAVADKVVKKTKKAKPKQGDDETTTTGLSDGKKQRAKAQAKGGSSIGTAETPLPVQEEMVFEVGEIERALYAKIVKKCGNRHHWEDWASDVAKIAKTHIDRIQAILENSENTNEITAFNEFAHELRDDLNNSVSDAEIIEMLAQHLITKPVFDALFKDHSFAEHNPMSLAMQKVLDALNEHHLDKEVDTLNSFYESVRMRAEGINTAEGKQSIILTLYDSFFKNAFPRMTEKLGIVYTPVEVVDFIIHSVNDVLKSEFGKTFADDNVHVLDPFTGTGTFINRLLQSGLIPADRLIYKYKNEIHANEIVLLAYYIASINIETVYHDQMKVINPELEYTPFEGICLTDTFEMYEKEDLVSKILIDNSARRKRQKDLDIRVIIGNPPYSSGQESANDNNANVAYPHLDERIRTTYAEYTTSTNKNSLYDSYIRAIRWASDRIKDCGVIGFVTNGGYIDTNSADGLRKCLADEFSSLYFFHLRGNQRTSGERSRQEGGKIFGGGSRAPIVIAVLVKNPKVKQYGQIYFHDIGDYLSREDKLEKISDLVSINGITAIDGWTKITPDEHNDWLNQRDDSFSGFIEIGNKKDKSKISLFLNYSRGAESGRDAWVYQSSNEKLKHNIESMINFYNNNLTNGNNPIMDTTKISWTSSLLSSFEKKNNITFDESLIRFSIYRPYQKQNLYFGGGLIHRVGQMPQIFPTSDTENLILYISGSSSSGKDFSVIITNIIPDLNMQHSGGQGFPLYLYEETTVKGNGADLFNHAQTKTADGKYIRKDAISDEGLKHFQDAYPTETISKEDIFYYVYGLLHSEDYRSRYADNLTKELPRIPCVKKTEDFWAFSKAGRDLAHWHLNYETVEPYKAKLDLGGKSLKQLADKDFYVTKMKFPKKDQKDTVVYNNAITIREIPIEAYDYVVNGKSALEWVMERQGVSTHKDSGIVNDANNWAIETMGDAKYPLNLFLRVIKVSLETMKIVKALPKLDI
ncbi:DEAD/DEAH box helicase family protein [Acinetobacter johnsonii]|uniref:DEAD/DEAH box helicase n=1 Tax=Acinetobacter TaxID=469 RepID=UPI001F4A64E2|nr:MULTISPECIES: type ISP restriction/modification enzyme [Acinetobacter]MCH7339120.1 DEAD/DEAH box helicase family protein [Acinetobacter higginsii]MCJ0830696.1 DEAD/DEAH box helicase family protein [Acinetobacter sp. NIPH1876]MDH1488026.1 DEAD/DEAH box helicase family protein [Acinetobacter johnsonii]MDH1613958.1 DEAD/DEAH box helicase family protein [Acinetobacter johnsonii]